ERGTDRDHRFADHQGVGVAEHQRAQPVGVHLQHGEVVVDAGTDDLRLVLAPVGQHHGDLPAAVPRGGDHVLVGDDVPVLAEHQTAAAAALLTGGHLDVDGAGQHVRGDRRYRLLGQVATGGAARTGAHL